MRSAPALRQQAEPDRAAPEPGVAVPAAPPHELLQLQRLYGNRAVARLLSQSADAERELDQKWNVDTSGIDPKLRDDLLARPALQLTIYEAYETGKPNDTEFPRAAENFAKDYKTVGLRTAAGGSTIGVGIPIAIRERGDLSQVINSVYRTVRRLAEGEQKPAPRIETVAVFAHGIRKGLGLDPEGEEGHQWMGVDRVKDFVAAIRSAIADNVRFLLFACLTGASEQEPSNPKKPGALPPGAAEGEGSFAAVLAKALGGEAQVFAHSVAKHAEANPYARTFTGGSSKGREMFDVVYDEAFITSEADRVGGSTPAEALKTKLRAEMWNHYVDAVDNDHYRTTKHFKIGGYGGVGAALFMDPAGTARVLQDDFRAVWMNPARVKALGGG